MNKKIINIITVSLNILFIVILVGAFIPDIIDSEYYQIGTDFDYNMNDLAEHTIIFLTISLINKFFFIF